jgi:hypothetical protein
MVDRLESQPYTGSHATLKRLLHFDPCRPSTTLPGLARNLEADAKSWLIAESIGQSSATERAETQYLRSLRDIENWLNEWLSKLNGPLAAANLLDLTRRLAEQCFRARLQYKRLTNCQPVK